MFKIGNSKFIVIDDVLNTEIEMNKNIIRNLNLIEKQYEEIIATWHFGLETETISIYHDRLGQMSYSLNSGVIAKNINAGDLYFVSYDLLKDKDVCKIIDDNIAMLRDTLKKEFYTTL